MLKLVVAPNKVLSQKAQEYKSGNNPTKDIKNDKFLVAFLGQMEKALLLADDPKGVGLAAPQVGKSLAVFMTKPDENSKTQVFINPKITEKTNSKKSKPKEKYRKLEGCLSLPNIWGEVERADRVVLDWIDEKGKRHSKKFSGFMATIIQHEIDHLDGVLFPRRVLEQGGRLFKSRKDEKGKDVFEELSI